VQKTITLPTKKVLIFTILILLVASMVFMLLPGKIHADTLNVGPGETYNTIQDAINAANDGDIINVAAGEYIETGQIVIDKDISIIGESKNNTIIKPNQDTSDSGDGRGWFLVKKDAEFNLSNVTLDGEGKLIYQAIRSLGTGTINNNNIKNMKYKQYFGWGIATFGNITISNNTITNFERIGIQPFGADADNVVITNNTIIGKGPGDYLQYGIEVGGGAKATISQNTISRIGISTTAWGNAGISINSKYADPGDKSEALITENTLTENEYAIWVGYNEDDENVISLLSNNSITGNMCGVYNKSKYLVDATNNWWGDSSGPSGGVADPVTGTIADGSGDEVSANVKFDPWLTNPPGYNEPDGEEIIIPWVRDREMTCFQVWINEDNNFEFVFWWEYYNNNWVKIYDMEGNEVFSIDMEKGNATFEADLPDGMYTVKTFHNGFETPIQEFLIGKP